MKSEEDILNQAPHLEIQSVGSYKTLHELLYESELKSRISKLLDMESDHVSSLRNLLRQQRSDKDASRSQEEEEKTLRDAIAADHARSCQTLFKR